MKISEKKEIPFPDDKSDSRQERMKAKFSKNDKPTYEMT